MSREIKFRAWDDINKIMDDDVFVNGDGSVYDYASSTYNTPNTEIERCDFPVMQYTGLKDKNGVEIYEGDICKVTHSNNTYEYSVSSTIYEVANVRYAFRFLRNNRQHSLSLDKAISVEVIGNIYENPELMEVKS